MAHAARKYVQHGINPGEPSHDPSSQIQAKRQRMAEEGALWQPAGWGALSQLAKVGGGTHDKSH